MALQGQPPSGLTAGPLTAPLPPGVRSSRREKRQVVRDAANTAAREPRVGLQTGEAGPCSEARPPRTATRGSPHSSGDPAQNRYTNRSLKETVRDTGGNTDSAASLNTAGLPWTDRTFKGPLEMFSFLLKSEGKTNFLVKANVVTCNVDVIVFAQALLQTAAFIHIFVLRRKGLLCGRRTRTRGGPNKAPLRGLRISSGRARGGPV